MSFINIKLSSQSIDPGITVIPMRYIIALTACAALTLINSIKDDKTLYFYRAGPQGTALQAVYAAGYVECMIPAAILAERLSAKWLMAVGIVLNVSAALIQKWCITTTGGLFTLVTVSTFVQGGTEGACYPILHTLIAKWAPPKERSLMASTMYCGIPLGLVIASTARPIALDTDAMYYVVAAVTLLWSTIWYILVEDTPEQQAFISPYEKRYIQKSLGNLETDCSHSRPPFPFKQIVLSWPHFAVLLVHVSASSGLAVLTDYPVYENLRSEGTFLLHDVDLQWAPNFFMWLFVLFIGLTVTRQLTIDRITVAQARKFSTVLALVVPMSLPATMLWTDDAAYLFLLRTLGFMLYGAIYSGFFINHIDLAPNFAGTLLAFTMTVASIGSFATSLALSYFERHMGNCTSIFLVAMAVYFVSTVVLYWYYCSGDEQPWNSQKCCGAVFERGAVLIDADVPDVTKTFPTPI